MVASRTRSMVITYASAIVLVMLYLASLMMVGTEVINFDGYSLWAILDPFGFHAYEETTFTWTVEQHNTLMPALTSTLILNRLFWIGLSVIAIACSYSSYRMKLADIGAGKESPPAPLIKGRGYVGAGHINSGRNLQRQPLANGIRPF